MSKKMKKKSAKTDKDYCRLDDALATLCDWREEILDELSKRCLSWKIFSEMLDAMRAVHSPPDE